MKNKLLAMTFLCVCCLTGSVYATDVNMDSSNKEVKPGETVTVKLSVKNIDIEEGVNAIQGKLVYDKEIFEKVENDDITSINNWSMTYNDEETDSEGKFIILKLAAGVKEDEDMIEINLKVKDDAKYAKTDIELQELCTVENDSIVGMENSKVNVKVKGKFSFFNWVKSIFWND
ncbi:MAG: hypothetical protein IJE05_00700 [Clostridia bacterium]|nr:hypothetical protein [Clostridia bacterium]